jgi:hypothetical protein
MACESNLGLKRVHILCEFCKKFPPEIVAGWAHRAISSVREYPHLFVIRATYLDADARAARLPESNF